MRLPALLEGYAVDLLRRLQRLGPQEPERHLQRQLHVHRRIRDLEFDLGHTFNYAEMAFLIFPALHGRARASTAWIDPWVAYEYAKVQRLRRAGPCRSDGDRVLQRPARNQRPAELRVPAQAPRLAKMRLDIDVNTLDAPRGVDHCHKHGPTAVMNCWALVGLSVSHTRRPAIIYYSEAPHADADCVSVRSRTAWQAARGRIGVVAGRAFVGRGAARRGGFLAGWRLSRAAT